MGLLLSCHQLAKSYHARPLFDGLSFGIEDNDRLGIIGANGAGKSTLLRILAGLEEADAGEVVSKRGLRIVHVAQDAVFAPGRTPLAMIAEAYAKRGVSAEEAEARAWMLLSQLGFASGEQDTASLSGGYGKRLAIGLGIAEEPDVLLLDEPTNHLDLDGILWLETLLKEAPYAWAMVSHDRALLDRAALRTLEVSRIYPSGALVGKGGYETFLKFRDEWLEGEARRSESLANKARREQEWLARGPKARTTKARFRIDQAHALMDELASLNGRLKDRGATRLDFGGTGRQSKRLLEIEDINHSFGERLVCKGLNLLLVPQVIVGIVGVNGSGKSTLLKILAGELAPMQGERRAAEGLKLVYFDQKRRQLDLEKSLRRTLSDAGDAVVFRGRSVHIITWAKRFQFTPEQLDLPIKDLSGGEKARALIARLMLEPADVLLLDEPTNDLDIETLDALEESLLDFPGAVVLVTHDRYMMARVADIVLGLDGQGNATFYADYAQWENAQKNTGKKLVTNAPKERVPDTKPKAQSSAAANSKRLSYMEQREFDAMEASIAKAEALLAQHRQALDDPALATNAMGLAKAAEQCAQTEAEVEGLYRRWSELEAKLKG